ncbi:MAG: serine hydrolase domain-containing protein [Candidatus Hermodarchaeota archaeon]
MKNARSGITQLGIVVLLISSFLLLNSVLSPSVTSSVGLTSIISPSEKPEVINTNTPIQLNETDLTMFLDETIPSYMDENHVAGITISVVKESDLLFAKGYGYADITQEILVTANGTLFGIASISKTFTATAVMKLVENGILDLNEDINNYLESFQVPVMQGANPITLAHLLSHTAGFEESLENIFYSDYASLPSMGPFLRDYLPARVHPPGYIQSYSNLGSGLAGLIVQEVTDIPFGQYVEDQILKPLGMNSTTAYQELPSLLESKHSKGYTYLGGEFITKPHYYCAVPPCGGMSATSRDIANFMIMYLNEGSYKGEQFLEEDTVLQMQAEQFVGHPSTWIGYGFYSRKLNNQTLVGHTGGMPTFSSIMALLPEHEVGIFISINTDTGSYGDILTEIMDRYYPNPTILEDPLPTTPERLSLFEGYYLPTRRVYVSLDESLISMYGSLITQIIAMEDNSLLVRSNYLPIDGMSFVEVDDLVFYDKSGQTDTSIAFREEGAGNFTFMFLSLSALTAMEKLQSWYLDVTGPESLEFNEGEINNRIYWSVSAADWQGNTYSVYRNGSSVATGDWSADVSIKYYLNGLNAGTYNFTIVVADVLQDKATHTVIVHIIARSVDNSNKTSFPNIGFIVIFLVLTLVIRKRTRKLH